jgi:HicA toxin of bacterial toxin-antitoxin,
MQLKMVAQMTKKEKILKKLLEKRKDFTWKELTTLLKGMGYKDYNAGRTSGSRVRFIHDEYADIMLHKPHPTPVLKRYQLNQIIDHLRNEGLL